MKRFRPVSPKHFIDSQRRRAAAALAAVLAASISLSAHAVTKHFTGGAGTTNWFTSGNWSPPGVPASADDVIIDENDVVTVPSGAADAQCRTLICDGMLSCGDTGDLFFVQSAHVGPLGTVVVEGGFSGPDIVVEGTLRIGTPNINVAQVTGGPLTIAPGATLDFSSGSGSDVVAEVINNGTTIWQHGSINLQMDFVNNGLFQVTPSLALSYFTFSFDPDPRFVNNGTMVVERFVSVLNGYLDNHGEIVLTATGNLSIAGNHSGTFHTDLGSTLNFKQPTTYLPGFEVIGDANIGIVGDWPNPVHTAGTVTMGEGSVAGDLVAGGLDVVLGSGHNLVNKVAGDVTVGNFTFDSHLSTFECDGTFTIGGNAVMGRGTLRAEKTVTLAGSSLTFGPSAQQATMNRIIDCDMELYGTTTFKKVSTSINGKVITNHGTLIFEGEPNFLQIFAVNGSSGSRLVNLGEVIKQESEGFRISSLWGGVFFEQRGTITATEGTLIIEGGSTQAGLIDGTDGEVLIRWPHDYEATFALAGSPTITVDHATVTCPVPIDFDGFFYVSDSTMTFAGDFSGGSLYAHDGSNVEVLGAVSNAALIDAQSDSLLTIHGTTESETVAFRLGGTIVVHGGLVAELVSLKRGRLDGGPVTTDQFVLNQASDTVTTLSCDITVLGSFIWGSQNVVLEDSVLVFGEGATVQCASTVGMTAAPGSTIHEVHSFGPWINNSGTFVVNTIAPEIAFFNHGGIQANKGTLVLGNGTHTGSIGGLAAGTLVLQGIHSCAPTAVFTGDPKIIVSSGSLVHDGAPMVAGSLSLFDGATATFGGLTVTGTLSLAPGTTMDAGGATFAATSQTLLTVGPADGLEATTGAISVDGVANLDGVVKLSLGDGVSLNTCDSFPFLDAGWIATRYGGATPIGSGTALWRLVQTPTSVTAIYAEGDLDGSAVIDVGDVAELLALWMDERSEPGAPGDLTCDGVVNGADLGLLLAALVR